MQKSTSNNSMNISPEEFPCTGFNTSLVVLLASGSVLTSVLETMSESPVEADVGVVEDIEGTSVTFEIISTNTKQYTCLQYHTSSEDEVLKLAGD